MTNSAERPTVPPWLHKLFTGHQYPYVRRLAKFAQPLKPGERRQEPTKDLDPGQVLGGFIPAVGPRFFKK